MSTPEHDRAVLLRYHEIALKGQNRRWFEDRLEGNVRLLIERGLRAGGDPQARFSGKITRQHGRILIETAWNENVREALCNSFGLSSFSPIRKVPTDHASLIRGAIEEVDAYIRRHGQPSDFRVLSRRSDKVLPETSVELDQLIGGELLRAFPGLKVKLEKPALYVGIEVRRDRSFIWTEKVPGLGGLPVGSNGPLLAMLSGGLDSPVAAIQTLRRGSATRLMHFYGTPFVGEEVLRKVIDLARIVNRYQPKPEPLHVVPFGKLQERIALATSPKLRTVLYRRMMVRIACALAPRLGAHGLVTGESLGQVASQTVENLATINAAATLPIIRPLVTCDKDEIIAQAQRWGSYETSIRPGLDCCTLFADRHPALHSSIDEAEAQESRFPVQELVDEALAGIQVHEARW
ncbi:MAG: tRNA 4-thiouridine(8) synthase ThiI [Oligoflexia bacterium]|nr:tRNA 4-thiouridine(8) synthase ThiI [Oligoflexia bacterium]